jgi:enolase
MSGARSETSAAVASVFAFEALDSRGNPAVGCEVRLVGGGRGAVVAPSGKSTGAYEARELRDGGVRYDGLGVRRAVANVIGPLADAVRGIDATCQDDIDAALRTADGSADLGVLGSNAIVAVSLASTLAAADACGVPLYRYAAEPGARPLLPLPMVNVISGGLHAGGGVDVQDFLVIPVGAESFSQAIEWVALVRRSTASVMIRQGIPSALVADEGGLGPPLPSNRRALELLTAGIEAAGFRPDEDVVIALDLASTHFYDAATSQYVLSAEGRILEPGEWAAEVHSWVEHFPIVSVEDVMAEDDWEGWKLAGRRTGFPAVQSIGDDLFVTDPVRLRRGIDSGVANGVLVKVNQAGTVSQAREVTAEAQRSGYATVMSARSGDTEDAWLADLAVGWRAGQIKVGSTTRSERTAKWNRLLRIEAELGADADYAGRAALAGLAQAIGSDAAPGGPAYVASGPGCDIA